MKNSILKLFILSLFITSCSNNTSSFGSNKTNSIENNNSSSSSKYYENSSSNHINSNSNNKESTITNSNNSSINEELPPISYVQVFAPITYTHIYSWIDNNGVTELCGSWPGTILKEYNDEWKTYDFVGYTELNVIFSTGSNQNQTKDLYCPSAGYYWYYDGDLHTSLPGE